MTDATSAPTTPLDTCPTDTPADWPYDELLPPRNGLLVVLSGPSGVGKDSVIDALTQSGFPLTKIVTATTRPIRNGEVNGKDYRFLTPAEFTAWREQGKFLEWAEIYGRFYGTPKDEVRRGLAGGETVLLKIDVQGAAQIKAKVPNAVYVFLGPGSFPELVQRLGRRGTETEEQFQRRIQHARWELAQMTTYDYLVINRQGQLDCATAQIKAIIVAERLRVHPRPITIT